MRYKANLGCFGLPQFQNGGMRVMAEWNALEAICLEYCGGLWIGIYSAWDIIEWANRVGLFVGNEHQEWLNRMI